MADPAATLPRCAASTPFRTVGFVAALFLTRVAFGFQFQAVATMAPDLAARFGLPYAALGALVGAYMLPGVFAALPGGMLGRRFGDRVVIGAGLVLMTAGNLLPVAWFDPAGIWLGRAVSGTGAVALVVLLGKAVADRFPGRQFMPVMGLLVGGFPIGVGLAGLGHDALGPAGLLLTGAGLALAGLVLFLPSADPPPRVRSAWSWPSRREAILSVVAGVTWTFYNAGFYGFLTYLPSVMAARGEGGSAAALTVATWPNLPFTVLGGIAAARFGNTPVLLVGMLSSAAALAGAAFTDAPLAWSVLFGTLGAVQAGVIVGIGTLSARPENRAVGMGLFYVTYYAGGALFPTLCGAVADRAGTPAAALLAAAALSLLAIGSFFLHRRLDRAAP